MAKKIFRFIFSAFARGKKSLRWKNCTDRPKQCESRDSSPFLCLRSSSGIRRQRMHNMKISFERDELNDRYEQNISKKEESNRVSNSMKFRLSVWCACETPRKHAQSTHTHTHTSPVTIAVYGCVIFAIVSKMYNVFREF